MSQAEDPRRLAHEPTVQDVRQLMGGSTPHFALQIRNRIRALISGLPADHPARLLAQQEIARLEHLSRAGQDAGEAAHTGEPHLPSLSGT